MEHSTTIFSVSSLQLYEDAVRLQHPQNDCMLSASASAAHAEGVNVQMFTAFLSTLVLLTTIAALLAATYRSPQPEHLSLCYSIACTPFCLFVHGLQKSKDGCSFLRALLRMTSLKILSLLSAGMFISEVVVVLMPTWTERLSSPPRRSYVTESVIV